MGYIRFILSVFVLSSALVSGRAEASRRVGLGIATGVAIPHGTQDFDPALSWGFHVDIPLLSTFHIAPSTLVYRLDPNGKAGPTATDVSLNFKFMIPLGFMELFAGITAGLTAAYGLDPHIGGLAGGSFRLASNIDVYAQVNYRVIMNDEGEDHQDLHVFAGPLFHF